MMGNWLVTSERTTPLTAENYRLDVIAAQAGKISAPVFETQTGLLNRFIRFDKIEPGQSGGCEKMATAAVILEHTEQWLVAARDFVRDDDARLYDFRRYMVGAGQGGGYIEEMLAIMPVREQYSDNHGIWLCETPDADIIVHLWGYADYKHREATRARIFQDKDWLAFAVRVGPQVVSMHSTLLMPLTR